MTDIIHKNKKNVMTQKQLIKHVTMGFSAINLTVADVLTRLHAVETTAQKNKIDSKQSDNISISPNKGGFLVSGAIKGPGGNRATDEEFLHHVVELMKQYSVSQIAIELNAQKQ